ncbi:hypothetical protein POM88_039866 [Heracleum sosnowskyi]|uniref:Embryo surrounding factor 1 brassicaceae domain-containing protein n=1 Tax=Heracleum sosnowskyi TaxID=360622 RepID=A0AAD8M6S6_9APIA|nr:hypothetical protein POM88_039866 [Heracleum sosnowskyi]
MTNFTRRTQLFLLALTLLTIFQCCWATDGDRRMIKEEGGEMRQVVDRKLINLPRCQPRYCAAGGAQKCWCCEFSKTERCWDWHHLNDCEANCPLPPSTSN